MMPNKNEDKIIRITIWLVDLTRLVISLMAWEYRFTYVTVPGADL